MTARGKLGNDLKSQGKVRTFDCNLQKYSVQGRMLHFQAR